MRQAGFTLIEMMISVAIVLVVSMLGYIAFSSSYEAIDLNQRMGTLQGDCRDAMRALSDEAQMAVKRAAPGQVLPAGAQELRVNPGNPREITYVVPTADDGTAFSPVRTIRFESEDLPAAGLENGEFGNGRLDPGEDTDGNGRLTRQLVLINGIQRRVLGSATTLANVAFDLSADGSCLVVTMTAVTPIAQDSARMLRVDTESTIYLMN